MNNRVLIFSLLSLSLIGGDTPPAPGYVTMTNQNPANPPHIPQINPQYPQNPPPSNGVGSSAAGGLLGLLINAGKPNPPDINTLRKEQYEANFQEAMRTGNAHDVAQFYPEKFVDKNPVYGFPELQNVVTRPERGAFFSTPAAAPVVTPNKQEENEPHGVQLDANPFKDLLNDSDNLPPTTPPAPIPVAVPTKKRPRSILECITQMIGAGAAAGGGAAAASSIIGGGAAGAAGAAGSAAVGGGVMVMTAPISIPVVATFAGVAASAALANCTYQMYYADYPGKIQVKNANNLKPTQLSQGSNKEPDKPRDRKFNTVQRTEAMNKLKKDYQYNDQTRLYKLKDNGTAIKCTRTGKDVINIKWDNAHGDIEALNKRLKHMGSLDPQTFEMYKGPVKNRVEL